MSAQSKVVCEQMPVQLLFRGELLVAVCARNGIVHHQMLLPLGRAVELLVAVLALEHTSARF